MTSGGSPIPFKGRMPWGKAWVRQTEVNCTATGRNGRQCLVWSGWAISPLCRNSSTVIFQAFPVSGSWHALYVAANSQSISTFLNCWKVFLNTVIYPQKNREHAPSPPQYRISTNCHPRPDPTNLPTQEEEETAFKACNRQPQYICHKKNFYFSLMTLNTTATREKTW